MNTAELEALITGAEETDVLEFKGAMSWDRNTFVKDILAMANVIDGGRIVVGVEDGILVFQQQFIASTNERTGYHHFKESPLKLSWIP